MDQGSAKWREILERSGVSKEMLLEVAEIFRNTGSQGTLREEKKKGKASPGGEVFVLNKVLGWFCLVLTGTFLLWEHRAP